jgi:signal transduction histidine kinase
VHLRIASNVHFAAFDPEHLRHIFFKLLSHAIKFSPEGGEVGFDVKVDGNNLKFRWLIKASVFRRMR